MIRRYMVKFPTKSTAFMGVFASIHAILYLVSFDLWRSWSIYLEPLEGIILGPWIGFTSALIGSVVARSIKPTDLWVFGIISEPVGVLACGLIVKRKWKLLMVIYVIMLGAYFLHPLGRQLPAWTILDILVSFVMIYPISEMSKGLFQKDVKHLTFLIPLIAFVGTVTDALTRIFLLIPGRLYTVLGWPTEIIPAIFIAGAASSYLEDLLVVFVTCLIGAPLLVAIRKIPGMRFPVS